MIIFLIMSISSYSQRDSLIGNKDSLINISSVDTIKNHKIFTDSIPADSIQADSIQDSNISTDAIDQVIEYTSNDSILFSLSSEKMYLYGPGSISSKDMNLSSSYVEISTEESYLYSETVKDSTGLEDQKPILTQDNESFNVKSIKYNFKTKKAIVKDVKMEQEQGYLHSDVAKMQTNKEFHIKDGKFTTCDLDHPHFYIKLTKAKKIPDKHVISGPLYFVIADIPLYVIGLPFGMLPNQKKNSSGILIPEYGEEKRRGFFLRNGGYFLAINDYINASLVGDIYSKGSWGLTLMSNFRKIYQYSGNLQVKYNKNQTGEKILPNSTQNKSFWVIGSYMQDPKANPNSNFSVSLNFGSSEHKKDNAVDIQDLTSNQTSSSISYKWAKPGSIFNFSANINGNQNSSTKMYNISLPTLSLNMKRQFPFKNMGVGSSKWYQKIGITLNVSAKNSINSPDSLLFTRQTLYKMKNGLKYTLPISTSFNLLRYINVSPSININGRMYSSFISQESVLLVNESNGINETIANDTISKVTCPFDFQVLIQFSTKIYGKFPINKGRVQAIRHVLSPSVSFSYRPDFSSPFWGYYGERYVSENQDYLKYSYYNGYIYGSPPMGKSGSINFSLGNNFEMKLKNKNGNDSIQEPKKIKLLDNLSMNASYNLAADSLNLSNINITGSTRLFNNFSVRFSTSLDPYTKDSSGIKINKFEINENSRLARFDRANISLSGSLKPYKKNSDMADVIAPFYYYQYPDIPYADFDLPWNISVSYTFNIANNFKVESQQYNKDITQTLSLNGNLSLTKNWSVTGNTTFDFKAKKFSYAQITVNRDLHCWEMSFNVIPFGTMQSYSFRINVKSSVFKGIEYNKKKAWQDNDSYMLN